MRIGGYDGVGDMRIWGCRDMDALIRKPWRRIYHGEGEDV